MLGSTWSEACFQRGGQDGKDVVGWMVATHSGADHHCTAVDPAEAEVGLARGKSVKLISRELRGITEQTYYRWRREYGGMKVSHPVEARRLKERV